MTTDITPLPSFLEGLTLNNRQVWNIAATNAHHYRVDRVIVHHLKRVNVWVIKTLTARQYQNHGISTQFAGATLREAWHKFYTSFQKTAMCPTCDAVYSTEHFAEGTYQFTSCPSCEMRSLLHAPGTCAVCTSTSTLTMTLECNHVFCRPCLVKWKARTCPLCRVPYVLKPGWFVAPRKNSDDDDDEEEDEERAQRGPNLRTRQRLATALIGTLVEHGAVLVGGADDTPEIVQNDTPEEAEVVE